MLTCGLESNQSRSLLKRTLAVFLLLSATAASYAQTPLPPLPSAPAPFDARRTGNLQQQVMLLGRNLVLASLAGLQRTPPRVPGVVSEEMQALVDAVNPAANQLTKATRLLDAYAALPSPEAWRTAWNELQLARLLLADVIRSELWRQRVPSRESQDVAVALDRLRAELQAK